MKLEDLQHPNVLARPAGNKHTIPDGAYNGTTTHAEFVERESKFSNDNTRVVLNLKVEVQDDEGEVVDLYIAPNYSWSKRGNMLKILEKLAVLPAPGEAIDLDVLVGIPVQVIVENVEKDGETYSNIASIKRVKLKNTQTRRTRKPFPTKPAEPKHRTPKKHVPKPRLAQTEDDELFEDDFPSGMEIDISSDTADEFDSEELGEFDEPTDYEDPNDFFDEDE